MCQKIFDDSQLVTILRPHYYFIHSPFLTVVPVSWRKLTIEKEAAAIKMEQYTGVRNTVSVMENNGVF